MFKINNNSHWDATWGSSKNGYIILLPHLISYDKATIIVPVYRSKGMYFSYAVFGTIISERVETHDIYIKMYHAIRISLYT